MLNALKRILSPSRTRKILSIDGGGIRGIVPAMVCAEIEARTQKPISESFDMIAGTSTGGILALALTKPDGTGAAAYSARDMVSLYETEGKEIFSTSIWHTMHAIGNLVDAKYPSDGMEAVLGRYFGEARLKDSLTELLIPSYEIERRIPFFFKSSNARKKPGYDFLMKDVARATSAAPAYFEPMKISMEASSDYYALIDGGIFANNPALCALVEAQSLFRSDLKNFLVVSLGTGELKKRFPYEDVKEWGLAQWTKPVLSIVSQGVSDTIDYQMNQLLPPGNGVKRYHRFQTKLEGCNEDMDDAGPENIRHLKLLAESFIRERSGDLDILCRQLGE